VKVLAISHERDAGPGVFAEAVSAAGADLDVWHRAETDDLPAAADTYGAVITFGGAMHVDQGEAHRWIPSEIEFLEGLLGRQVPVLGVCLGAQLLTVAAGGEARRAREPEIGWRDVTVTAAGEADPVLGRLTPGFEAYEWHSYECLPPAGATVLATSDACVQAFRIGESSWGIQFHAEVTATDALGWIRDYATTDPDAIRLGIEQETLRAQTRDRIGAWNELGRGLCTRFLAAATRISPISGVT
jgi:GMP synthase (glutamine-hydrolysing)